MKGTKRQWSNEAEGGQKNNKRGDRGKGRRDNRGYAMREIATMQNGDK